VRLRDRVALVTGAGSGLGAAIADSFAREGAAVVANDLTPESARRTVALLPGPSTHLAIAANVSESAEVEAMISEVGETYGRIDILVNNAGISEGAPDENSRNAAVVEAMAAEARAGGPIETRWDALRNVTDASWNRMLGVNLTGIFYCTRAALPWIPRGGSVVNIASMAFVAPSPALPHYAASKAGIVGFTRAVAGEFGPLGIRANAIAPGVIATEKVQEAVSEASLQAVVARAPLGRVGRPEEIASAALFLASEDSSYVTGQTIHVNGGVFYG